MSGTMFTSPSTPGSSDVLLDLLTDRVGCKSENTDDTVSCLKTLPTEKFVLPLENRFTNKFTTIDGDLFPAPIKDLIKDKVFLKTSGFFSRDYLVTLTNNEGAVEFFGPFNVGVDPESMSASFLNKLFQIPVPVCEKILAWYKIPGHFAFRPSHDILCDYSMVVPTYRFLETAASFNNETTGERLGRPYFLYFDYQPSYLPPGLQGMGHGFDLMYLFDILPDQMLQYYYDQHTSQAFTETDFQMKNLYIHMLTDFMKSGDPSVTLREEFNVHWPPFDPTTEDSLIFSSSPSVRTSPLKDRNHFWSKVLPQYLKEYLQSSPKQEL